MPPPMSHPCTVLKDIFLFIFCMVRMECRLLCLVVGAGAAEIAERPADKVFVDCCFWYRIFFQSSKELELFTGSIIFPFLVKLVKAAAYLVYLPTTMFHDHFFFSILLSILFSVLLGWSPLHLAFKTEHSRLGMHIQGSELVFKVSEGHSGSRLVQC